MKKDSLSWCSKGLKNRSHTSKHAIFIANGLIWKFCHTVSHLLPILNRCTIIVHHIKIAKCWMLQTLFHFLDYAWCRRIIHIGNPHRNLRKAFLYLCMFKRDLVYCDGACPFTIQNRCKIIFHFLLPVSFIVVHTKTAYHFYDFFVHCFYFIAYFITSFITRSTFPDAILSI